MYVIDIRFESDDWHRSCFYVIAILDQYAGAFQQGQQKGRMSPHQHLVIDPLRFHGFGYSLNPKIGVILK
jgi:hypothetical protein